MTLARRPRRLAWRLYGFALIIVFVTIGVMIALPALLGHRVNERDAQLVRLFVDHLVDGHQTDQERAAYLDKLPPERIALAVFDRSGRYRFGTDPSIPPPDGAELAVAPNNPIIARTRIVIATPDGGVAIHAPAEIRAPVEALSIVLGLILALTLLATIWFARTIATPLAKLSATARALGRGETTARVDFKRRDELGEVGRSFDEMADRIGQLLQTQRAMMADISHELRTPLTRIKLALDLAIGQPLAAQQVLDEVGADLEEIEDIIDDVFMLVRLDSENELVRQSLDVVELIQASAARFRVYYPGRALEVDVRSSPLVLEGNAPLLRRAFDNLLDNAAKYSPEESPISIRLTEDAHDACVIEIEDRGVGMTDSEINQAFTPFWRADASRARGTGGVGLGLALVRKIARAHGGEIELISQRASGTRARFRVRTR